ncbi:MAG TPA: SDR family oxidoreductase [Myxococcota bacterium]|nr:SDR family oxidoreductase [Myxococcota bacterium]
MTESPPAGRYEGRVVVVTGARRGVGALIASHFASHGAEVVGFSRHADEPIPSAPADGVKAHERIVHLVVDVGNADSVREGFEAVRKRFGRVDILVNNAAVLTSQYAMIMPAAAAQNMVTTNLLGTFLTSREAAKLMRKGKWGRIINIGSMAVSLEPMGDSVYAATKAGISTLANVMAKELASINVTCNTLGITAIETDMLRQLPRDKVDAIIANLPIPRMATTEDILNVVDFFASPASGYVTAQTIYLGGVN